MTQVRVRPGVARGTVRAPPSKSYTHRALAAGHLSRRPYHVLDPLDSDDTRATARGLRRLGSTVRFGRRDWAVRPSRRSPRGNGVRIDCRESGTTLRFLSALAALRSVPVRLEGEGRLPRRPMGGLLSALRTLGAECRIDATGVVVRGPIHSGTVRLDASTSSQFASALLLALPSLEGESTLRLERTVVSEPYIDATLAVLRYHRVRVGRRGRTFRIEGPQRFRAGSFRPPGDASSAAYLWAAAATSGGSVEVAGVDPRWPQADRAILRLLADAGAAVHETSQGTRVAGRAHRPFTIDLTGAPDLYPLAGVLAATIPGRSELRGASHVTLKESNRKLATSRLARALGARVRSEKERLVIEGSARPRATRLTDLSDHRLVMSAAVGALAADRTSTIGDARAVAKSFPDFWATLESLRERRRP